MHINTFVPLLVAELNKLSPEIAAGFHASADYRKFWDGTITADAFRIYSAHSKTLCFEYCVQLTVGSFVIRINTSGDDVRSLVLQYQLAQISDHTQPLYRNCIERGTWDAKHFENEKTVRALIKNKVKGIVKGVSTWFNATHISPVKYAEYISQNTTAASTAGASDIYFRSLMGAAGRLRLNAELYSQRTEFYKIPDTRGRKLADLANLFMEELRKEIENAAVLKEVYFYEGY